MDNIFWNFLLVKVFDPICMEGSPWWTLGIGLSFHWKRNNWVNNVLPPALPPNYLKITNSDQSLPVFAKTLFVVSSRSTANKQEKINLCLKEIGSFILSINHPETFPLFVWNKYIGLPGRVPTNLSGWGEIKRTLQSWKSHGRVNLRLSLVYFSFSLNTLPILYPS